MQRFVSIPCFLLFATSLAAAQSTMAPLLTRAWDNHRSGWNQHETVLTQANVKAKGITRITTIPVYGDARGIESQPLILPGVQLADGTTHDVMVLPSMANIVRGVDATTGAALWQTPQLGTPITGSDSLGPNGPGAMCPGPNQTIDCYQINDKWGVLSTGVIDPDTQLVYLVAWISPDTTPQNGKHFMYVLNVKDGSQAVAPVLLDGKSGTQTWSQFMRKQRSSLVMTNIAGRKTIFFASGTIQELGTGAAGWVLAYDVATNQVTAALATSQGFGGGIWMGGQGLAADSQGFLYGVTGNGSFDGVNDFAESILKIQYTPPAGQTPASLKIVSWWTPYSDTARSPGGYPGPTAPVAAKPAGVSAPSQAVEPVNAAMRPSIKHARIVKKKNRRGQTVPLVYPKIANTPGAWWDEDLGSAQGALLENEGVYIVTGKDGIAYPTRIANLGNTMPADLANAHANCAKLASPPVWLTEDPGPVDPCPADPATLNFMPWGKTRHMHMTPVQYRSPTRGQVLFAWGENSQLHAWAVSPTGALTYLAQGNEFASPNVANTPGGMPGGFCSMSSNGSTPGTALLVCTMPYGDANTTVTNGRLLVYDPDNWTTNPDGSLTIPVLWDSQQWNIQFLYNKFNPPIVDGGEIYVPNYNGGVDVYSLTP
ncbi:MAG TPA: hypothetical protein VHE33_09080 [Acidobacteriaceae bacterium]|nr:hypothetical protein [Acidobacteriaceae bacterium]